AVPEVLLVDFTLLPLPVPINDFGILHLALTPLLQLVFGDGSGLFSVPVPPNPNLAGLVVHAQGFGFVFNGQSGVQKLSNLVSTTLTAPAPQPRFLFVANAGDSTISQFLVQESNGKLRQSGVSLLERAPHDLVANLNGTRLYVLTPTTIDRFIIDGVTGALTPIGSPTQLPVGTSGEALVLSPGGNRLYLVDSANDRVLGYSIGSDDAFAPLSGSPWSVGGSGLGIQGSEGLALDAQGRFLAVVNGNSDVLSVFEVGTDGALGSERIVATSNEPSAVTFLYQDQSEPLALVTARGSDDLRAYQLAADGTPSLVGQTQLAFAADPVAVRADRFESGDRVYVTNAGTGTVDVVLLTDQGQLSVPSPSLFGSAATDLALAPTVDRAFALFAGDGELSTASLAPDSGALMPVAPPESPTDRNRTRDDPRAIAIVNGTDFARWITDRVYQVAHLGREVAQYSFDETAGLVAPLAPAATSTAGQPNEAAVHPTLGLLFVSNFLDSGGADLQVYDLTFSGLASASQTLDLGPPGATPIWAVDVDPTGSLVLASVATLPGQVVPLRVTAGGQLQALSAVAAGDIPRGGALDATGRFYYVANSLGGSVSQYRVDAAA
ncbi:MAG: beta-propeller fold lactonase family protein, partial [Planctomycetota bacterium]